MSKHLRNVVVAITAGAVLTAPAAAIAQSDPVVPADSVGTGAPAAVPAVADTDAEERVTVNTKLKTGVIRTDTYTPAPGVTPQQLATSLRAEGKAAAVESDAVQGPASSRASAAKTQPCWALGDARAATHRCFVRWRRNGFPQPQIVINDHAQARWQVPAATADWNRSRVLNIRRDTTCRGIAAGVHCIPVISRYYGKTPKWIARASYARYYNARLDQWFFMGRQGALVTINTYYNFLSASKRRSVTCHELGHALGLGHAASASGCMTNGKIFPIHPSHDDFLMLRRIYRNAPPEVPPAG